VFEYNGVDAETFYLTDPYLAGTGSTLSSPTVQSSNAFTSSRSNTSLNISWTRGDGTNRILIGRKDGPVNVEPQDFQNYSSSSTYGLREIGTENYVLYTGTGNNVNVNSLEQSTNYHFALFEYNGSSAKQYLRPGYAFSLETFGERPTVQVSNATYSNITSESLTVEFTKGNGSSRLVLAKKGESVDAGPSDFNSYSESGVFAQGDELGEGNFVVFNGDLESFDLSGLEPAQNYFFAFYEAALTDRGPIFMAPPYTSSVKTESLLDIGVIEVLGLQSDCDLTKPIFPIVRLERFSSPPIGNFKLGIAINGETVLLEDVNERFQDPNQTIDEYQFVNSLDLSQKGTYEIRVFLDYPEDTNESNNELTLVTEHYPTPETTITADLLTCPGVPVQLDASGGVSYQWSTGETSSSISVAPTSTTSYTVLITDENGCSKQESVTVETETDPCACTSCPDGFDCFQGVCFEPTYQLTVLVTDPDGVLLPNVLIKNELGEIVGITSLSEDGDGSLEIVGEYKDGETLQISKIGYKDLNYVFVAALGTYLEIVLIPDCEISCPENQVCHSGICEYETIYLAGHVVDKFSGEPIADVKVEPSGEFGGPVIFEKTDQSGYFMIKIKSGEDLYFSKTGYVAEVLPDLRVGSLDLLISLETGESGIYCPIGSQEFYGECRFNCVSNQDCPPGTICVGDGLCLEPDDLCLVTNCPEGTVCYQGQCLEDPIIITGRVTDLNSLENLENVSISLASGGETLFTTSENGQYQVVIDSGEQLQFTAAGYSSITTDPILASNSNLVIEMETLECEGISCPPGYFCENGSCVPRLYAITG
ncbi:hypothetical protein, partial [Algoriphagus sp.]|uniref:hypothetical protein n=1 Tax=Algoriphagus sp. TaxID=1872435 RepID=UPI002623BB32